MKPPEAGWDPEEREALRPLAAELAIARARHADDPPLSLLRAGGADALPPELQGRVSGHLAESRWSRALVDGANELEPALDDAAVQQLLDRVTAASREKGRRFGAARWWLPALASAAVATIVGTAWLAWREAPRATPSSAAPAPLAVAARSEPGGYAIPLRAPQVRLSVAALTWRGPSGASSLVDDLAPGLDAFRASDYARAAKALEPVERTYPRAVEAPFYRGIALLYSNAAASAVDELQKAGSLADATFAPDVEWYLAIAEQRAGHTADARRHLETLCNATGTHAAEACDALAKLTAKR